MNYGEVKAQFAALLNRRDATTAQKETWMQQGFERIQRELRIPAMEKIIEVTVDGTYDDLTIPNDYLGLIEIRRVSNVYPGVLDRKSLDEVLKYRIYTNTPRIFAREGGKFLIGPYPTSGTVLRLVYHADYPSVSADTDENLITEVAPSLAVYAGLTLAGEHFADKRTDRWEGRYNQIKEELEGQGDDDELKEASVSSAYYWPSDY